MFISYEHINSSTERNGKHRWTYELTDSEFGTVSTTIADELWISIVMEIGMAVIEEYSKRNLNVAAIELASIIIKEYSKRNLNVAANLAVAFNWYNENYPWCSIRQMIDDNKKYNPLFPQYEKDLQKYLVLL
jgi:hypothetical protein